MRPEGFNSKEIRKAQMLLDPQGFSADREIHMIEAGADAMLEGLKKNPVKYIVSPSEISFWGISTKVKSGYLVFIGEE